MCYDDRTCFPGILPEVPPPAPTAAPASASAVLDVHAHLHRLSSTSDSQLHKTLSHPAHHQQPQQQQQQQQVQYQPHQRQQQQRPIVPMASAVSPLIGHGDGVWETSSTASGSGGDLSEAREDILS